MKNKINGCMKRSFFIKTGIAIVTVWAAVSCGGKDKPSGTDGSVRQVVELSDSLLQYRGADTIDMGRMKSGEIISYDIRIANSNDKPLVIVGIDKSCGCVEASYPKKPIKPGETGDIKILFDSKGLAGWIYKTVGVTTSLGQKPYLLILTADII